jgi:DNA invertase Pin-like site-specific DNA recombinase
VLHIFGAMAEFERNLTRERTHAGLKYAKEEKGMKLGAKPKISPEKRKAIAADLARNDMSVKKVAKKHRIGTSTIYYLFPGGRHKMLAKGQKEKATRKVLKAALRSIEAMWSRNGH